MVSGSMMNTQSTMADGGLANNATRLPQSMHPVKMAMIPAAAGTDSDGFSASDERAPLLPKSRFAQTGAQQHGRDDARLTEHPDDDSNGYNLQLWNNTPWYRRPSVYWLLFPYALSTLVIGGLSVPKLNLMTSLICSEYYADISTSILDLVGDVSPHCRTPEVQQAIARFSLQGQLITGILSAIIAPKLGALSDRHGRIPIMMITSLGILLGEIITVFAAGYPATFPVWMLLVGFLVDGLAGSSIAAMAVTYSYATDCTLPSKRNVIFAYFHGVTFIGLAVGPAFTAWVIRYTGGIITVFYIALGFQTAYLLFLVYCVPESLPKSFQMAAREKHRQILAAQDSALDGISQLRSLNLYEPLRILWPTAPGTNPVVRRNLAYLAGIDGIIFGIGVSALTSILLYSQRKFAWSAVEQSWFLSVVSLSRVICLLILLPAATRLFRGRRSSSDRQLAHETSMDIFDLSVVRLGISFDIIGFFGYLFADSGAFFIASGAVASMGGMGSPTLQAGLTKHVPSSQIGQLLGAMGLIHATARVIAPAFFNIVYAETVKSFDRAIFVILIVSFSIAWLLSWMVTPGSKSDTP